MTRVVDEYVGYVWHRTKGHYVQVGASLAYSFDECKKFFEEHRVSVGVGKYSELDFSDYHIKMRRITYTNWEVYHG